MAVQTEEYLKSAFGAGKFPDATDWSDLIDTIFAKEDDTKLGKVLQVALNGYGSYVNGISPTDINSSGYDYANAFDSNGNLNTNYPLSIDDIIKFCGLETTRPENARKYDYSTNIDSVEPTPSIVLIIHNDGFFYGYTSSNEPVYIKWEHSGNEGTILNYDFGDNWGEFPKKLAVLPLGGTIAFGLTYGGGWQPIGQYTSVDYDTFMQNV